MKPYVCRRCGGSTYYVESTGYRRCRECDNARRRRFYATHPGYQTRATIDGRRRKYGADADYVAQMLEIQGCACAICRERSERTLHVDHDHATQTPRGLLCDNCNRGLGMFRDDSERLLRAIAYLQSWSRTLAR